jgi:hypothetical protein
MAGNANRKLDEKTAVTTYTTMDLSPMLTIELKIRPNWTSYLLYQLCQ